MVSGSVGDGAISIVGSGVSLLVVFIDTVGDGVIFVNVGDGVFGDVDSEGNGVDGVGMATVCRDYGDENYNCDAFAIMIVEIKDIHTLMLMVMMVT